MSINFETSQSIPPPSNTKKTKRLARNSRLFLRNKAASSTSSAKIIHHHHHQHQAPISSKKNFKKNQKRKAKLNNKSKMIGSSSVSATKAGPSSSYQPSKHLVRQRNNNNMNTNISRFNQGNRNIHMQASNSSNHSNQFQNKLNNNNNFNRFLKTKSFKNKQNNLVQQQQIQQHSQQQPQYTDSSAQSNSSYSLINKNNNNNAKFQLPSQHVSHQQSNQQQQQQQFINPFKFIQSKTPTQQQQFISNAATFFQLIRNEFTFNITHDDHRSISTSNNINDKNQQSNRQASAKQLHPYFNNHNMINQMNGDQQMKQQVIHSKLLPKFKYFKFGGAVQPGKKTKNTAPYNTTQYIMYDYSKRLSKEQVCPNGQSQFSNDWNMALAASADSNSTKLVNFNSPIYINNYNSGSDAHENDDMDFLEELSEVTETKAPVESMLTRVTQPSSLGAYKRSKSIEIINVNNKEACSKMEEEDAVADCSKLNDILSSSF